MKTLPGDNAGPQWNNTLLDDLVFIKKHGRYPISKKTIPSVIMIGLSLAGGIYMLNGVLQGEKGNAAGRWFLVTMLVICYVTGILRYLRTLRFTTIPTPFTLQDNMKLVESFLKIQQLNLYRHPQAPEVYQIASRPLGNGTQREVMIFVADDNRILVNSHFINQKWLISSLSTNAREMGRQLQEWIRTQTPRSPAPRHTITID